MPLFKYTARDSSGKSQSGELDAQDIQTVRQSIKGKGLFPITIIEHVESQSLDLAKIFQRKPKPKDIANLTRQFQVMFMVGVPMDKILTILANNTHIIVLKEALEGISHEVASGKRLSEAFSQYPKIFSPLYTNMLAVGETGGVLDKTLNELASVLEKEHSLKAKVKSAMLYPKIVMGALIGVTWLMLAFVFPPFQAFYASNDAELPLPTKILMALSDIVVDQWYVPIVGALALYVSWKMLKKNEAFAITLSKLSFKLPVFGKLNLLAANSHFGHLVAALYKAGVPLVKALGVVASTMPNRVYAQEVHSLKVGLEQGLSLSESMKKCLYFEPMVQQTCAIGEQTGQLDVILEATTAFYDEEISEMLKNLTTLIEPIMLFFLFAAVLVLALAVYLPIWNISKVVLPN